MGKNKINKTSARGFKKCLSCKIVLDEINAYVDKKGDLSSRCKICTRQNNKARNREYYRNKKLLAGDKRVESKSSEDKWVYERETNFEKRERQRLLEEQQIQREKKELADRIKATKKSKCYGCYWGTYEEYNNKFICLLPTCKKGVF